MKLSRSEQALAEIELTWERWRSPNAEVLAKDGWRPIDDLATRPLPIDDAISRSYRAIVFTASKVPSWRRILRRVR